MAENKTDGPASPEPSSEPSTQKRPSTDQQVPSRGPRIPRGFAMFLIVAMFFLLAISLAGGTGRDYKPLSFADFQKQWDPKSNSYLGFDKAELRDDILYVRPMPDRQLSNGEWVDPDGKAAPPPPVNIKVDDKAPDNKVRLWYTVKVPPTAFDSRFLKELASLPGFVYDPMSKYWASVIMPMFWFACFGALLYFFVLRPFRGTGGPGGILSFGRSKPKLIGKDHLPVRFSDVAGIDEAKDEVKEVIEFLKTPKKFEKLGGRIPRGLLFVGSPGTGKTLLAKAIAGEADVPFFSISGSDFVEMFVGVGASRVRDLFRQAKENAPCIIFLDEVDAVGRKRGSGFGGGHDEREQTLNAILVEMDGFDTNEQVVVIAATNRPDVLDSALLRPGRFDREVVISLPDIKGRFEILKVHARKVKLAENVDLETIARGTPMYSGAELEAIINEAAIHATMAAKEAIDQDDLEEARDKVRYGRERRSLTLDETERKVTAYHEAGHAMLMRLVPDVEPLHKVTIIPRGMALGTTMWLPLKEKFNETKKGLLGRLKVLFGGRIAEELFCGDISVGASSDIERATAIARQMVCDWGMTDELGPIRYASKEKDQYLGSDMALPREFSEATAERIDAAVSQIIGDCYRAATELLTKHREDVELLATALLKHESLSAKEVQEILTTRNLDSVSRPLVDRNGKP